MNSRAHHSRAWQAGVSSFCQVLKGAVVVTLWEKWGRCKMSNGHWLPHLTHRTSRENRTDEFNQSHCPCFFCGWGLVVNSHVGFYFCLILVEDHANCSFQWLILSYKNQFLVGPDEQALQGLSMKMTTTLWSRFWPLHVRPVLYMPQSSLDKNRP